MRSDTQKRVQEGCPRAVYHTHCEIYRKMRDCIIPSENVFEKQLKGGVIRTGDGICILTEALCVWKSGPSERKPPMNINQLKYVLTIAASSSMREASTKLYLSQPALSASVREPEEELGILIFERSNKGVFLTDEGREFLSYAKKAVGQYAILEDRYLSRDSGRERFSVSTQHYNFAIKAFAQVIRQMRPERFVFSIHETKTKRVLEDVNRLKSEVGVLAFSGSNEAVMKKLFRDYHLAFTPLMRRETYVYVWNNHPLVGRAEVSIREMQEYPCVSFDQSSEGVFYLTEEAMADYPFDRLIKSEDRATSMELIAQLGGYSIGSGMLSGDDAILQGLTAIKLKDEDPLLIGYITRKGSLLSVYGENYVKELLKYREITNTEEGTDG